MNTIRAFAIQVFVSIAALIGSGCDSSRGPTRNESPLTKEQHEAFIRIVSDPSTPLEQRLALIARLGSAEHPATQGAMVHQKLARLLKDEDPRIAASACSALSDHLTKHKILDIIRLNAVLTGLEALHAALDHSEASVRLAALQGIRRIKETHGDYNVVKYHPLFGGRFNKTVSEAFAKAQRDSDKAARDLAQSPTTNQAATWRDW